MANGRGDARTKRDDGRDPGRFLQLPVSVLECPGYLALSPSARSLMMEVFLQFKGDNNGKLLLSRAHLASRGWKSADVIQRAKVELLARGFIFETVKGHRPNRASWYAVTWRRLDKISGFDLGIEKAFERGAYRRDVPLLDVKKLRGYQADRDEKLPPVNKGLIPSDGTGSGPIAPSGGTESKPPVPSDGAMGITFRPSPVPSHGHLLEKPSAVAASAVGVQAARAVDEVTI